jgi:Mechanosensitive ion channel
MRTQWKSGIIAWCLAIGMLVSVGLAANTHQDSGYRPPANREIIAFLFQSIDWYRQVTLEKPMTSEPADLLFLDDNQATAVEIVRQSFDFAKAETALASPNNSSPQAGNTGAPSSDLAHFVQFEHDYENASRNANQQLEILRKKVATASGADRRQLQARLDQVQSRLKLLEAGAKSIQEMIVFLQQAGAGETQTGSLSSTIDDLSQTVPELNSAASPSARPPIQVANSGTRPEQSGILGMVSRVSVLHKKLGLIDEAMRRTDNLALSSQNQGRRFTGFIAQFSQSSVASNLQTGDLAQLQQQKVQLDTLTTELKNVSPAILALDKQQVLLRAYKARLSNWRTAVKAEYREALKDLILDLAVVAAIIGFLAVLNGMLRRITARHVRDANRRRLIGIGQSVVIWFTIVVVAAFALASEWKSLATYFGLLAAGLAVALQNVILSALGYLVLVGKQGIRVGDWLRISGNTGQVSNISLLQLQLREFDEQKQRFTGHLATFSNAFVFLAPAIGLFKLNRGDAISGQREQQIEPEPCAKESTSNATASAR